MSLVGGAEAWQVGWMGGCVGHVMSHDCYTALQKGTGKWTAISALDKGIPVTLIGQWHVRARTHTHTHTHHTLYSCTRVHNHMLLFNILSLPLPLPPPCAGESVFARCLSSLKEERTQASKILKGPSSKFQDDKKAFVEHIRRVSGS